MATYFHGNPSEIAAGAGDGLQTLILMNPAYVGYSDSSQPPHQQSSSNFVFLNSNSAARHHPNMPPPQTQHFVGIPLQGTATSLPTASPHDHQDVSAFHGFLPPRVQYNLYNLPVELGAAREVTRAQQGLSLSLSSQQPPNPPPPPGYGSFRDERAAELVVPSSARVEDHIRVPAGPPSPASGVTNGVQSVLLSSKYLKAAQELLDEVVNVGRGVVKRGPESFRGQPKYVGDTSTAPEVPSGDGQSGGECSAKRTADLTTTERQEIQMKKAKLVNMLDEVEQRYRQYHHQMQIVISWFEQAAGVGSAKAYTCLALETISKQFRCLKDAILAQIKSAGRSLGEEESMNIQGSRLKYVDNQIRQQRALQQLGMIQHNAWRPQRGLPERSVSILRAWLFEHFLHPYPKDSDKLMLAKQTGLTRSQVSNWFINARVRLWKPMVEEMYIEEMKEHETNGLDYDNNNKTARKSEHHEATKSNTSFSQTKSPKNTEHHNNNSNNNNNMIIPRQDNHPVNPNSTSPPGPTRHMTGFNIIGSSSSPEIESITRRNSPKKLRTGDMLSDAIPSMNSNMDSDKPENDDRGGFTLMGTPANFIGGFGSYPMGELGRFGPDQFQYSSNGVSLTLGLPHCENLGGHQTFMPDHSMHIGRNVEIAEANGFSGINGQTNGNNVYEDISIQDRKRFAAQLLPDFVA
ncbi:hypothetical protein OROHE_006498 [Orobanche hederae]